MFFQPPDKEQQPTKKIQDNPRRKRKKKSSKKNKRCVKKEYTKRKNNRFTITMSSWAESFTSAATWQLKHQVAYWKSKATTLEYENQILHDIIKKIYTNNSNDDIPVKEPRLISDSESEVENDFQNEFEEENDDIEVSEEFIQFLKDNAKYKEDAKRERELLKSKVKDEQKPMDMVNEYEREDSTECMEDKLKELYGKDWQRIAALEMSMKCNFMNECDRDKPMYWPNIPFNFNYS